MRLNRAVLDAITVPPGKEYALLWDDAVPGFGVRANAGGSRAFIAQWRNAAGVTKRVTLGRVEALSLEEARKAARSTIAKAMTGVDPVEEKAKEKARAAITLASVADAYVRATQDRLRPSSHRDLVRYLGTHWASLRPMPCHSITRAHVAARLREILESSGPIAANRARACLSSAFSWAIGEGILDQNPVVGTNRPSPEVSRDRVLSDAEIRAVWRSCRDDQFGRIVRLLLMTGQRRDEVGSMALSEISRDLWTIPGDRTKNRRAHDVHLHPAALALVHHGDRVMGRDLVFGHRAGGFSGWSKAKREFDQKITSGGAVMHPWRLHDLRRTAATNMATLGVAPHVVESLLNHASGFRAGVAGVYNRASYALEKRHALDTWANHILTLVGESA